LAYDHVDMPAQRSPRGRSCSAAPWSRAKRRLRNCANHSRDANISPYQVCSGWPCRGYGLRRPLLAKHESSGSRHMHWRQSLIVAGEGRQPAGPDRHTLLPRFGLSPFTNWFRNQSSAWRAPCSRPPDPQPRAPSWECVLLSVGIRASKRARAALPTAPTPPGAIWRGLGCCRHGQRRPVEQRSRAQTHSPGPFISPPGLCGLCATPPSSIQRHRSHKE
jgi:hypothetical protein